MPAEKAIRRDIMPSRGPRFWDEDGVVMFTYVIDPGSVVGPYPAREQDKRDHPEAWTAYEAARNAARAEAPRSGSRRVTLAEAEAMPWPQLRKLAASLSDQPIRNKDDALAVVASEAAPAPTEASDDASHHDPERL